MKTFFISIFLFGFFQSLALSQEHYKKGLLAIKDKDWSNAAKHLEEAYNQEQRPLGELALLLAQIDQDYLKTNDRLYYALVADQNIEVFPEKSRSALDRIIADLSFKEANFERAKKHYQRILEREDSLSEYARYQLAWVYVNLENKKKAVSLLLEYDFSSPKNTLKSPIARDLGRLKYEYVQSSNDFEIGSPKFNDDLILSEYIEGIVLGLRKHQIESPKPMIQKFAKDTYYTKLIAQLMENKEHDLFCEWAKNEPKEIQDQLIREIPVPLTYDYIKKCPLSDHLKDQGLEKLAADDKYLKKAALLSFKLDRDKKGCMLMRTILSKKKNTEDILITDQKCDLDERELRDFVIKRHENFDKNSLLYFIQRYPDIFYSERTVYDQPLAQVLTRPYFIKRFAPKKQTLFKKLLELRKGEDIISWVLWANTTQNKLAPERHKLLRQKEFRNIAHEDIEQILYYKLSHKIPLNEKDIQKLTSDHVLKQNIDFLELLKNLSFQKSLIANIQDFKSLVQQINQSKWFHSLLQTQAVELLKNQKDVLLTQIKTSLGDQDHSSDEKKQLHRIYQVIEKMLEEKKV